MITSRSLWFARHAARRSHACCDAARQRLRIARPPKRSYAGKAHGATSAVQPGAAPAVRPISPPPRPLDAATGFAVNEASMGKVPEQWQPLLEALVAAYKAAADAAGLALVSVQLRGSLPRGLFLPGVSDVDTFAVVAPAAGDTREAARERTQRGQRALTEAVDALAARHAPALGFTKIEARLTSPSPGSGAAAWLAHVAALHAPGPPGDALPADLLPQLPGVAFLVKAEAINAWGVDLAALLPDVAALPPAYQLLPSLTEDVAAAVAAARRSCGGAGGAAAPGRAPSCWALKRCLRAAFELAAPAARVHTRDLFWCESHARQRLPRLAAPLARALELYVGLAGVGGDGDAEEACELASRLADELDSEFLEAMLTEEPGWLTMHEPPGAAAGAADGAVPQPARRPWWPFGGAGAAAAGASSSQAGGSSIPGGGGLQAAPACLPPPVRVPVEGPVRMLDWGDARQGAEALAVMAASLGMGRPAPDGEGSTPAAGASAGASVQPGASRAAEGKAPLTWRPPGPPQEPLLLRGLAAGWAAGLEWGAGGLAWLAGAGLEGGLVRLAPSLQFPYVQPPLLRYLRATKGAAACPSLEARMSGAEFAQRLSAARPTPLVYRPREYAYLQAELPERLAAQLPIGSLLCQLGGVDPVVGAGAGGDGGPQLSQRLRLWVSPPGAVSPCHYDTSASFLVQLGGAKRMLFFAPAQLPCLYPYPDTHLLRRRAAANLAHPDYGKHPLLARARAREAWLGPGDAVWFPRGWMHHTESHGAAPGQPGGEGSGAGGGGGCSMSLTFRLAARGDDGGAARQAGSE